jgi:periplasmic divalent cation tolerance protein
MKRRNEVVAVLVTAPDKSTARKLARAALTSKLIACANLIPEVESHYWWKEKVERGKEVLMLLKTTLGQVKPLEKLIVSLHPYDTPEFLVLTIKSGNRRYLAWLTKSVIKFNQPY